MAKISIDFSVHSSPYYIKVVDLSVWSLIKNKPSIIEITLPGYSKPITKFFDKEKLNVFNSNILGTSCDDCTDLTTLSDGIYTLKVIGSPETYNKEFMYLKTDLHDMEVDKIFVDNADKLSDETFQRKMTNIEFLKKGAEAHLRLGDTNMARQKFEQAQEMVEDLIECSECR